MLRTKAWAHELTARLLTAYGQPGNPSDLGKRSNFKILNTQPILLPHLQWLFSFGAYTWLQHTQKNAGKLHKISAEHISLVCSQALCSSLRCKRKTASSISFFKTNKISIRFEWTFVFFRSEINFCSGRFCCNYNNLLTAVEADY